MPATLVGAHRESRTARTLLFDAPELAPALAGQHVTIRLTAEDGYTAQRAYSLGSAAGARPVQVTIERFDEGEVSPYLVDDIELGDTVEMNGPIGGWLVWRDTDDPRPVQLIAGGSGVVPLMSMLRTRQELGSSTPFRLLYSATDQDRAYYRDELAQVEADGVRVDLRYTRQVPPGSALTPGRLTRADIAELVVPVAEDPAVFVCGPSGFVEAVADALVALGHPEDRVRLERFGATS